MLNAQRFSLRLRFFVVCCVGGIFKKAVDGEKGVVKRFSLTAPKFIIRLHFGGEGSKKKMDYFLVLFLTCRALQSLPELCQSPAELCYIA